MLTQRDVIICSRSYDNKRKLVSGCIRLVFLKALISNLINQYGHASTVLSDNGLETRETKCRGTVRSQEDKLLVRFKILLGREAKQENNNLIPRMKNGGYI